MNREEYQLIHIDLGGQDDNLGDSVLRRAYLESLRGPGRRFHILVGQQTSDYMAGFALNHGDAWFTDRGRWMDRSEVRSKPVLAVSAGEINPRGSRPYPADLRIKELEATRAAGGLAIIAGIGMKDTRYSSNVKFAEPFREAAVVSWRDSGSREAAGFGEVNPDWAFALGTDTATWAPQPERGFITVTLRFDRPYPGARWLQAVRHMAASTGTRVVTIAQVARDAPRAVRLASDLGGEYLAPPSFAHDSLEAHVRSVFQQSLAVISDRAHGLIIGATEGAYPIGSAANPHKISRLLDEVDLGALVGSYDALADYIDRFPEKAEGLAPAINSARDRLKVLSARIDAALENVAS